MARTIIEETIALTALTLFLATLAVWVQVIGVI